MDRLLWLQRVELGNKMMSLDDFTGRLHGRLAALPIKQRAAFAASCAERQFGTYVFAGRTDERLKPEILRHAIDRCWDFIQGKNISGTELSLLLEQVENLIPDLNEDTSALASFVLNATATASYLLKVCLTGDLEDSVFASECALNSVDEWVMGQVAPPRDGLSENIISIAPHELRGIRESVDSHPLMLKELSEQNLDLDYLGSHDQMSFRDCGFFAESRRNQNVSNIDLG